MARIILISRSDSVLAKTFLQALKQLSNATQYDFVDVRNLAAPDGTDEPETIYIYMPSLSDRNGMAPDLSEAETVLRQFARLRARKFILLSSALIYGTGPGRQSLVAESYRARSAGDGPISDQWRSLEEAAKRHLQDKVPITVLRPTTVLSSPALLSRRLTARVTLTLAGHDPVVQLLSL